ncbi:IS630 transposase-related protein [Piscirickettsia salmonis]|uniref:IS630 transposase-related protein n=1 Tax=Piscirickettsia salmonis TaxID=1238 RepID=UPI00143DD10F|nr:IS630 transposase-related protein [Piscirickettsia salmonis]QIX57324.1 helix-turn-helix domain-containing protein [Piscirickettsia salmonis]
MPSPYSYDLRVRALKMIDEGILITQVSKLLKISRDTLHRWKNRRDHTGDVKDLATKRAITIKSKRYGRISKIH